MQRKGKQGLEDIYVVGCGNSLEGFAWSCLLDKTTIAVNGAVRDVPNPDYFVTADSWFAFNSASHNFWGINTCTVLVMREDHKHYEAVERYVSCFDYQIRPVRFDGEIGFDESDFCTGQNSGFCGMQLAVILGAKRIHLLGMDFQGHGSGNYHGKYNSNPRFWDEFFIHFQTAIGILQQYGIEIINHSSVSRLCDLVGCAII